MIVGKIDLIVFVVMVCIIAFTSGFLWTGDMLHKRYQYDMYITTSYLQNQIVGCVQESFRREKWYLGQLDIQSKLCTDYMVDMYNDMCDENPKKGNYDSLKDLE